MKRIYFILCMIAAMGLSQCTKDPLLDDKNSSAIVVPSSLPDLQSMLDNAVVMNVAPILPELTSDNYYLTDGYWQAAIPREHNAYTWASNIFEGQGNQPDWNAPYQAVLYANIVLEALDNIARTPENAPDWDNIKGSALFFRAFSFFNLAQTFARPYDSATANNDLGIPLKLSADINVVMPRASVNDTYDQVIRDLRASIGLLSKQVLSPNRPSIPAATGLLARVFLTTHDYSRCRYYADSTLNMYASLIDYNNISGTSSFPFTANNDETILQASSTPTNVLNGVFVSECGVDSLLYNSYDSNDLRKQIFFRVRSTGICTVKGNYTGTAYPFTGIATDELYLMRAEANTRMGDLSSAAHDLDELMMHRYKTGTYVPVQYSNATGLLNVILKERRKELLWRGLRFIDLRRLNQEGYNITLTRIAGGRIYQLLPKSALYVMPIPDDEIASSGIQQNQR